MSNRFDLRRGWLAGIALAMVVVFALPAAAQAAPVGLGTAGPFVAIGSRTGSPFAMSMRAAPGTRQVRVRITFKDSTRAKTVTLPRGLCRRAAYPPPRAIHVHRMNNLSGAPGSAASHGCIRLRPRAITWLARRIGAGIPLTVTR